MSELQATYSTINQKVAFDRSEFEDLIQAKGRNVIIEKAILCGCKSKSVNSQSNCKNCGGSGYTFLNPRLTRIVLQKMKAKQEYMGNGDSVTVTGDLQVTARDGEELTFMDRITLVNSKATFNEVLFFKVKAGITFAYTTYNIKFISYIGYFTGVDTTFQRLELGTDYTFENNIIKIVNPAIVPVQGLLSITVRYIHAAQYHIADMDRESMESFDIENNMIHLPISGTARKAHYIITANNLNGDRLLNNSYETFDTSIFEEGQTVIDLPPNPAKTVTVTFVNETLVEVTHGFKRSVSVTVYDLNNKVMTPNIGYEMQMVDINNIEVTFPQGTTGKVVIQ